MLFSSSENLCLTKETPESFINTMKSDGGGANLLFDHPFFSFDSSINAEFVLKAKNSANTSNPVAEITNCTNNSNNSNFACYLHEIVSKKSIMASTKSKVPDILMINKYYGLIPQKFTISSRKTANSTPSSASTSSRRTTKSSSARPRAKSSTYQHSNRNSTERKHADENKGFGSENESPEPIKMILVPRRGSESGRESPVEKSSDPFGPVTKKMSVERYKRWKSCGGGKGRSMNMRSNSDIGQTLSQLDNRLPGGGFNSHAKNNNRASTAAAASDYMTNRRVIKIDLNRVSSWDEENYRITTSSVESTEGENKEPKMKVVNPATSPESDCMRESRNTSTISNINNSSYSSCSSYIFNSNISYSSSEEKNSPTNCTSRLNDNNNGSLTSFVNSDNDCDSAVSNVGNQEKAMIVSSIDTLEDTNESSSSEIMTTMRDSSTFTSCVTSSVEMSPSHKKEQRNNTEEMQEKLLACLANAVDENGDNNEQKEDKHIGNKSMIDSCENAMNGTC